MTYKFTKKAEQALQIANDIAKECPKSKILPGIAVTGTVTSEEVTNWLKMIEYEL